MSALIVYQFCTPCNRERAHKFTDTLTIVCTKCSKVTRIAPSREKAKTQTPEELSFKEEMTTGSLLPKVAVPRKKKVATMLQPVALLNLLRGGQRA